MLRVCVNIRSVYNETKTHTKGVGVRLVGARDGRHGDQVLLEMLREVTRGGVRQSLVFGGVFTRRVLRESQTAKLGV